MPSCQSPLKNSSPPLMQNNHSQKQRICPQSAGDRCTGTHRSCRGGAQRAVKRISARQPVSGKARAIDGEVAGTQWLGGEDPRAGKWQGGVQGHARAASLGIGRTPRCPAHSLARTLGPPPASVFWTIFDQLCPSIPSPPLRVRCCGLRN